MQNPRAERTTYHVTVKTAAQPKTAGTDANVYVELLGQSGATTGRHFLRNDSTDTFECGKVRRCACVCV